MLQNERHHDLAMHHSKVLLRKMLLYEYHEWYEQVVDPYVGSTLFQ